MAGRQTLADSTAERCFVTNVILIVVLSMYVNKIKIPVPTWSRQKGMKFEPFPLFELFPILISVIIGWIISYICTVCGVFPDDPHILQYQARTDYATDSIKDASYFTVPYPGQYGAPSFKVSYAVMMAIAVMGSILESVGDYVQTTGPSRVAVPPPHAINRGINMEGMGSFLSGAIGAGHATTSYSNIIGMIGITKVASRRVFNLAGLFMVLMGICGKLGAVFVAIPKPVLGGPIFISIALLVGAALSNLRNVDMFATRSQGVLGVAIMAGIVFPTWLSKHPGAIDTGIEEVDQSINAVVGTPLIVGVLVAMFLDMTVPGNSRLKQPTLKVNIDMKEEPAEQTAVYRVPTDTSIYDLPFLSKWLSKSKVARYIPFLPSPSQSEHRLLETTSDDLSSAPSSPTVVP